MKNLILIFIITLYAYGGYAQTTGYLRNDTVKITNATKNATLVLETASKGHGWYLKDVGNGRTQFVQAGITDISHLQDSLNNLLHLSGFANQTLNGGLNATGYGIFTGGVTVNGLGTGITVQGTSGTNSTFLSRNALKVITSGGFTSLEPSKLNFRDNGAYFQELIPNRNLSGSSQMSLPNSSGFDTLISQKTLSKYVIDSTGNNFIRNQNAVVQNANGRINGSFQASTFYGGDPTGPYFSILSSSALYMQDTNGSSATTPSGINFNNNTGNGNYYSGGLSLGRYGMYFSAYVSDSSRAILSSTKNLELNGTHIKANSYPTEPTDVVRLNDLSTNSILNQNATVQNANYYISGTAIANAAVFGGDPATGTFGQLAPNGLTIQNPFDQVHLQENLLSFTYQGNAAGITVSPTNATIYSNTGLNFNANNKISFNTNNNLNVGADSVSFNSNNVVFNSNKVEFNSPVQIHYTPFYPDDVLRLADLSTRPDSTALNAKYAKLAGGNTFTGGDQIVNAAIVINRPPGVPGLFVHGYSSFDNGHTDFGGEVGINDTNLSFNSNAGNDIPHSLKNTATGLRVQTNVGGGGGYLEVRGTNIIDNNGINFLKGNYTPANNATVVHNTGDEAITGIKTFSNGLFINANSYISWGGGIVTGYSSSENEFQINPGIGSNFTVYSGNATLFKQYVSTKATVIGNPVNISGTPANILTLASPTTSVSNKLIFELSDRSIKDDLGNYFLKGNTNYTPAPETGSAVYMPFAGGTFTGDVQYNVVPVNGFSLINKSYVDNAITGITWKSAVRVKTTANITLSGTQTIDGVAVVAGNRVLVNSQTDAKQNGIYVVATGAWTRPADADSGDELATATVAVTLGTLNKNTQWTNIDSYVPVIGTDNIDFGQISGAGTYTNGTGIDLTGNVFSLNSAATRGLFSAASPLTYNSTTGALGILQANGSQTGYLSSTDWSIFNGKQNPAITLAGYGITDGVALSPPGVQTGNISLRGLFSADDALGRKIEADATGMVVYGVSSDRTSYFNQQILFATSGTNGTKIQPGAMSGTNILTLPITTGTLALTSDITAVTTGAANPAMQVGLTAVNGIATTYMRSDAAPAIDQGIVPIWTNTHNFNQAFTFTANNQTKSVVAINPTFSTGGFTGTVGYSLAIKNNLASNPVMMLQNTNAAGYASTDAFDNNGVKKFTYGWANASVLTGTPSTAYFDAVGGDPIEHRIGGVTVAKLTPGLYSINLPTTITKSAIGATSTDGLVLQNSTAATSGVSSQYSPMLRFFGSAWNTTTTASNSAEAAFELRPASSAVPISTLFLKFNNNGAGFQDYYSFNSAGGFTATGGMSTSSSSGGAAANFSASGSSSGLGNSTSSSQLFGGATGVSLRVNMGGGTTNTLPVNNSYSSVIISSSPFTVPSGTTAWANSFTAKALGTATVTSGSITNTATMYIDGASSAGTNNYALYVASGLSSFGGNVRAVQYRLSTLNTAPTSSTDTGTTGEIRYTSGYIYVCTATNTWVRSALTTF